ncbi:MAG: hypothetical protein LBN93_04950 [Candidatus Symbiothrix sp.]|jgi:uncharacterized protein (TIGR02145 family)|nr:hypothetical protein [Candidatus Symbiothrix sp.]
MKRIKLLMLIATLLVAGHWSMTIAQVAIGNVDAPAPNTGISLLLDGIQGGLLLPQVTLTTPLALPNEWVGTVADVDLLESGLMVYNIGGEGLASGVYIWQDIIGWVPLGGYRIPSLDSIVVVADPEGELFCGDIQHLTITASPVNAGWVTTNWGEIDTNIATLVPTGINTATVTALNNGFTSITASLDGVSAAPFGITVSNTITDTRDGKVYKTGKFGNAIWMVENLAYEPTELDISDILYAPNTVDNTNTPYYYTHNDMSKDDAQSATIAGYGGVRAGFIYTWAAAMKLNSGAVHTGEGSQGICPANWHLPTINEWYELEFEIATNPSRYSTLLDELTTGNNGNTGQAFKSTTELPGSTFELQYASSLSADAGGFNVLLLGGATDGEYQNYGLFGFFWTSTSSDEAHASRIHLANYAADFRIGVRPKYDMMAVRCIKNQ